MPYRRSDSPQIFISVTHTLTKRQETFVSRIETLVRSEGFSPITIGRNMEKSRDAAAIIRQAIDDSIGTIVIAMEKVLLSSGVEYPSSDSPQLLWNRRYPSVWNQIEGAMTLQAQHPLLLMREAGLHPEGIFQETFLPSFSFSVPKLEPEVKEATIQWLQKIQIEQLAGSR